MWKLPSELFAAGETITSKVRRKREYLSQLCQAEP